MGSLSWCRAKCLRKLDLRTIRVPMLDAEAKTLFVKMADEYDQLAERAAKREHFDRDDDHRLHRRWALLRPRAVSDLLPPPGFRQYRKRRHGGDTPFPSPSSR